MEEAEVAIHPYLDGVDAGSVELKAEKCTIAPIKQLVSNTQNVQTKSTHLFCSLYGAEF
jgi:hypothetical protein